MASDRRPDTGPIHTSPQASDNFEAELSTHDAVGPATIHSAAAQVWIEGTIDLRPAPSAYELTVSRLCRELDE